MERVGFKPRESYTSQSRRNHKLIIKNNHTLIIKNLRQLATSRDRKLDYSDRDSLCLKFD